MAGGAPRLFHRHWNAAVWVKESVDDGAQHAGPAKQGKGLLIMQVWAARHAGHAQHGSHGSHGMGQVVKLGGRWSGAGRPARSAAQASGK